MTDVKEENLDTETYKQNRCDEADREWRVPLEAKEHHGLLAAKRS